MVAALMSDRPEAYPTLEGDGDGFGFGVGFEAFFAEFAAHAGHFVAAEGGGGVEDVVAVNPNCAGAELGSEGVGFGDVAGPDGGGEAVGGGVGAGGDLVDRFELKDGHDGAK